MLRASGSNLESLVETSATIVTIMAKALVVPPPISLKPEDSRKTLMGIFPHVRPAIELV